MQIKEVFVPRNVSPAGASASFLARASYLVGLACLVMFVIAAALSIFTQDMAIVMGTKLLILLFAGSRLLFYILEGR